MTIAAFVTNKNEISSLVPWGLRFAHADNQPLLIVVPRKSKGKQSWNEVHSRDEAGESILLNKIFETVDQIDFAFLPTTDEELNEEKCQVLIREIESPNPEGAFADSMKELDIRMLLIPAREPTRNPDDEEGWIYKLLQEAPCETMILRGTIETDKKNLQLVVVTDGELDTDIALQRAQQLSFKFEAELSLLYVRPDDDRFAMQVAKYQLERLDKNVRADLSQLPKTISLQNDLRSAIKNHCGKNQPDLVLIGTRNIRKIRSLLKPMDSTECQASIALIRGGVPFSSRLLNEIRLWVRARVPQMNREQRIKLVDRLNLNSNFDFDFVALIVLSTMIAAFGLVQDSGAVVIGAMLVAPLMTPLVGIGFSLIQSNERLVKTSVKSVLLGFTVAFVVGALIGLMITLGHKSGMLFTEIDVGNSQLQARGHPTLLDWFVAFVSGVAAAYAIGRPNLVSALPGVAIAAALVPPIATSGLAFSVFDLELSLGALLLFLTNIVAIALGTAVTFWSVGIDSRAAAKKTEGKQETYWPRYYFLAIVLASITLAGMMSYRNRPAAAIDLPEKIQPINTTDTPNGTDSPQDGE